MTIRLSGAQITRIEEFLYRYEQTNEPDKIAAELLVEQILSVVTPPAYLIKENGEICLVTNTPQTPKEQQSVSI